MAAEYDVVILYGPPYVGKTLLCMQMYREWRRVSAKEMFLSNSSLGLRDVILHVIQILKKDQKVVIDDENASEGVRSAYIKLIKDKLPDAQILVRKLVPRHGKIQLFWAKEYQLANRLEADMEAVKSAEHHFITSDNVIKDWCDNEISKEAASSGVAFKEDVLSLVALSQYKFEVPALFIQWEAVVQDGIIRICETWSQTNPCGRIIFISIGMSTEKMTQTDHRKVIKDAMKQLVQNMAFCPVYVFSIESLVDAGSFCKPPKPGVLAFLQRRHCLDLANKSTVYLYSSTVHMKMAESAGVQYLKVSRVLQYPLMLSSDLSVKRTPNLLTEMKILLHPDEERKQSHSPTLPCYNAGETLKNNCIMVDLAFGRREYVFASSQEVLHRYYTLYTENAAAVVGTTSRISAKEINQDQPKNSKPENVRSIYQSPRKLPKWMLPREKLKTEMPAPKSESTSFMSKNVYVMSEKELLDMAQEILLQKERNDVTVEEADSTNKINTEKERVEKLSPVTSSISETSSSTVCMQERVHKTNERCDIKAECCVDVLIELFQETDSSPRKNSKTSIPSPTSIDSPLENDDAIFHTARSSFSLKHTNAVQHEDKASVSKSPRTSDKNILPQRKYPKPDLSILDEIFF